MVRIDCAWVEDQCALRGADIKDVAEGSALEEVATGSAGTARNINVGR